MRGGVLSSRTAQIKTDFTSQMKGDLHMVALGLWVRPEARHGKEAEVEA